MRTQHKRLLLVFNDINVLKFSITTYGQRYTPSVNILLLLLRYSHIILHANAFAHQSIFVHNKNHPCVIIESQSADALLICILKIELQTFHPHPLKHDHPVFNECKTVNKIKFNKKRRKYEFA